MDLKELTDLIVIRDYVVLAIENPRMSKIASNELTNILIMLEKKIFFLLTDNEFKNYINYDNAKETLKEIVHANTVIKSRK